jgi:hypothetical protein
MDACTAIGVEYGPNKHRILSQVAQVSQLRQVGMWVRKHTEEEAP